MSSEVTRTGAVPPSGSRQLETPFARGHKKFKKVEGLLKVPAKVTSTTRSIISAIKSFQHVSSALAKASSLTKVTSIALTPFNIFGVVEDTYTIVTGKKLQNIGKKEIEGPSGGGMPQPIKAKKKVDVKSEAIKRVKAVGALLMHIDAIVDSVAATCSLVYLFKPVERIVQWIPVFSIVSFFVGIISLVEAGVSTAKSAKLVHNLRVTLKKLDKAKDDVEKAKILSEFLTQFKKEDIQPLLKKLAISSKANTTKGVNVLSRIQDIADKKFAIEAGNIGETEQIVRSLAGRAKLQLGLEVADLANRVVATIGKAFLAFAPPLAPVGFIILAATGGISLCMMSGKYFFLSKNPFDPSSQSRARRIVASISTAVHHLQEQLKKIKPKPAMQPAT